MKIHSFNRSKRSLPLFSIKALSGAVFMGLIYSSCFAAPTTPNATDSNVKVPSARITNTQTVKAANSQNSSQNVVRATPMTNTMTSTQSSVQASAQSASATANAQTTSSSTNASNSHQKIKYVSSASLANDPIFNASDISTLQSAAIPTPSVSITELTFVPTVMIATTRDSSQEQLDVSLLDYFITEISPNARHYPPNFSTASKRYNAKEKLKEFEEWIRPYAENPNASFDVLIRATKLNIMARNLDLGSDYAVRASNYVAAAIKRQPNSAEANFLYGMMLSEGGGFKESKKYLEKAAAQGYTEAEQSLAQADLLNDNRAQALERLMRLKNKDPNDPVITRQVSIVQNGQYYIWDLPSQ